MYRFLLRPTWLAFLLLGMIGAIGMPLLGQWQLRRYHDHQAANAAATQREKDPAVPFAAAVPNDVTLGDGKKHDGQKVRLTGTYDVRHQIRIANRSLDGRPGYHIVTPLMLDASQEVLINRGWVPYEASVGGPIPDPAPAPGVVNVEGRVRPTQARGTVGPTDPDTGELKEFARVDIERISRQVPTRLAPVYVELIAESPTSPEPPKLIPAQKADAGTNLSYAMQWFIFTLVGLITWPLIIRRQAARA